MAIPIVPILKFVAVQILVPIAIDKGPVLVKKVKEKIKEKKTPNHTSKANNQSDSHN